MNGNFSHNYFATTGAMHPVDLFDGESDVPLTLAFRGALVPEPGTALLVGIGLLGIARRRR